MCRLAANWHGVPIAASAELIDEHISCNPSPPWLRREFYSGLIDSLWVGLTERPGLAPASAQGNNGLVMKAYRPGVLCPPAVHDGLQTITSL
jgi:hypothetical protein